MLSRSWRNCGMRGSCTGHYQVKEYRRADAAGFANNYYHIITLSPSRERFKGSFNVACTEDRVNSGGEKNSNHRARLSTNFRCMVRAAYGHESEARTCLFRLRALVR